MRPTWWASCRALSTSLGAGHPAMHPNARASAHAPLPVPYVRKGRHVNPPNHTLIAQRV